VQYFVLWPDGQKFGPADVPTLQQWINEGRLTADSQLESVIDGSRCKVSDVPGLSVGAPAAPATPVSPVNPDPVTTTTSTVFSSTPVQSATPAGGSYFVIGPDASKYGPADVPTLSSWATENRLTSATEVEDAATGVRMTAAQIPGIVFPQATATTSSIYGGTVSNPTSTAGYSGASNPAYASYPRDGAGSGDNGAGLITASFICSGLGLICCPCLFSVAGIILGVMGKNKGNDKGQLAITLGIASLVIGIILGVVLQAVTGNLIPR
jgi:hypothetical protein